METVIPLAIVLLMGCFYETPKCTAGISSREKLYVKYKHRALIGHTIMSRSGISRIRCAALCLRHSRCQSFNHGETSGSCQIGDATKKDFPGSFQQVVGSSYFESHTDGDQNVQGTGNAATVSLPPTVDSQDTTTKALGMVTTASVVAHPFTIEPTDPPAYTFILAPMAMPFRLNFEVRTIRDALVALAEDTNTGSIFADITIGGFDTTKSTIRACFITICTNVLGGTAEHNEAGLLSGTESRPFWIEYKEGVVTVGKGGQEEAFLEWDAGTYHGRVPSEVVVGISAWTNTPGYWIFYN